MRILFFILIFTIQIQAQNTDIQSSNSDSTIVSDSSSVSKEKSSVMKNIFRGKPGKALTYSLLLPGAGHVYNRKWWKLPIVYGALALPVYFVSFNTKEYRRFDRAFRERVDKKDKSMDEFVNIYSLNQINTVRKVIDKNLQLSYLSLVGVYLLCGIDAYVDRHLMEFDVSEKLGLKLSPANDGSLGISVGLTLR